MGGESTSDTKILFLAPSPGGWTLRCDSERTEFETLAAALREGHSRFRSLCASGAPAQMMIERADRAWEVLEAWEPAEPPREKQA
jgi:hypothetical protein